MKKFTIEELAGYDGQNGNAAYIAAHGKVFDVSNNPYWINGMRHGMRTGIDWTEILNEVAPEGSKVLENLPQVGFLE